MKNKMILWAMLMTSCIVTTLGQVGIGTNTPAPTSMLDVTSTEKGFLPPRMTTDQREAISVPAAGLIIYNLDVHCLQFWNTMEWVSKCEKPGVVLSIDCAGAVHQGTLGLGVPASGVSSVISYTGGNGGTHSGQTVTSTGVTGLTATLAPGSFANGAGTLTYTITGTPSTAGTASFAINIGGQTCTLTRNVVVLPASYTITSCNKPMGYLARNLPANSADIAAKQELVLSVTSPGSYDISTSSINGVVFRHSGILSSAGNFNIELNGEGTPVNYTVDENTYNYSVTGSDNNSCEFARKVYVEDAAYYSTIAGAGNHRFIYKAITYNGKHYLQTNLGALYNKVGHPDFNPEMVAQSIDDYKAFGGLYQAFRPANGHALTLWTSPTNASFPSGSVWTSNYDSPFPERFVYAEGQYVPINTYVRPIKYVAGIVYRVYWGNSGGTGRTSCPTGFNYMSNIYTSIPGAESALASPLKLVAPTVFRNGRSGQLQYYTNNVRVYGMNLTATFGYPSAHMSVFLLNEGIIPDQRNYSLSYPSNSHNQLNGYVLRCVVP